MAALIPAPVRQVRTGGSLEIRHGATVAAEASALRPLVGAVSAIIGDADPPPISLSLDTALPPASTVWVSPGVESDEGYRLVVGRDGISCVGRTGTGVVRAAATLAQLLADQPRALPCQVIEDHPRFAWRGLMIDVARSFRTISELCELVDLCVLYKLNALHLHLTDNEAWRLELPGRPELTSEAAAHGAGPGFYSAAEFEQLQDYAEARQVTIVPEVDLPGHCGALVRALPGLAQLPRRSGLTSASRMWRHSISPTCERTGWSRN
jgi:hexosaminidase